MTFCIDCHTQTAGGLRCPKCHGAFLAHSALIETAQRDRELLRMVYDEKLNGQRLANRLGISKVRAREKILLAEKREALRKAQGVA